MVSKAILVLTVGFLCVDALPSFERANIVQAKVRSEVETELTSSERNQIADCLEKKGFVEIIDEAQSTADLGRLTKIMKACFQDVPGLRPVVLTLNAADYFIGQSKQNSSSSCNDSEDDDVGQQIQDALTNKSKDFCKLTFDDFLPLLCKYRSTCNENQDIDAVFVLYYSFHQMIRHHPESFVCKNSDGKDLLSGLINQKAYTADFNPKKEKFLSRNLPCNAKLNTKSGPKQQSQTNNQGSAGTIAQRSLAMIKPFVGHKIAKKFF
ncbi:hypothetical protein M3Y97_00541100 [Aphelenchoides bicaudatus]|nr:hypothetical protein M3Y97_00541100 [Aphelenchoides bicaudatus]